MNITKNTPPREFEVGLDHKYTLKDCARIDLETNELVTFKTEGGGDYDVARKEWGYYATPSTNGRLKNFGFKTALVKNRNNQFYIFLLEQGKEEPLHEYVKKEAMQIICWLDDDDDLNKIDQLFS